IAAGALHGLEHHRARLGEDHERARLLASIVDGAGGARVVPPDTNIVMLDLPEGGDAEAVQARAREAGVRIGMWTRTRLRMVTHLDVDDADVRRAGEIVCRALSRASDEPRATRSEPALVRQ